MPAPNQPPRSHVGVRFVTELLCCRHDQRKTTAGSAFPSAELPSQGRRSGQSTELNSLRSTTHLYCREVCTHLLPCWRKHVQPSGSGASRRARSGGQPTDAVPERKSGQVQFQTIGNPGERETRSCRIGGGALCMYAKYMRGAYLLPTTGR